MSVVLTSTPVVGLPALTGWAQVVHNHSGHLVCAYAVSGPAAHNLGRDLADLITSTELPDAVTLHQLLLDVLAKTRKAGSTLQLAAILRADDHLIVAAHQGQILYRRNGTTRPLLQAEAEPKLLEGKLIPDTTLVAFTQQADVHGELITQQLTQGWDVDTIVTSLLPVLHDQADSALSALAFVTVEGDDRNRLGDKQDNKQEEQMDTTWANDEQADHELLDNELDTPDLAISPNLLPHSPLVSTADHPLAPSRRITSETDFAVASAPSPTTNSATILTPTSTTTQSSGSVHWLSWLPALMKIVVQVAQTTGRVTSPTANWLGQLGQKTGQVTWSLFKTSIQNLLTAWMQATPKEKRRILIISLIVATGLSLGMASVVWQLRVQQQRTAQILTELAPMQTLLTDAQTTLDQDPVAARDKTNQAIAQLTELSKKYPQPAYLNKPIAQTLKRAQEFAKIISGQSQLQDLAVFFDLRLTEPDFLANRVLVIGTTAYFADTERKQVIQLNLEKKQSSALPLGELDKLTDLTFSDHYLYLLGSGLKRWDSQPAEKPNQTQPVQALKPEGDSDRDSSFMASFGSYVYLLNPVKRNIFRFAIDKQGKASDPVGWMISKKDVDFTQLTSLAVDGDLWLTDKTGRILKFTQGQPVVWRLTGVTTPPDSPIYLVTDDSLTKIYVLEPNRRRLLVLDKTGQFLKEISSPTLASTTGFGVSEPLGKAFAVSGSIVYEIGL